MLLLAMAGWINRYQQAKLEFCLEQIRTYKQLHGGKPLRLNDDQRRRLAAKGKELGLWPDANWVIEAKNRNEESLHKKDAGQLLLSLQWFSNAYPTRPEAAPVVVARLSDADRVSDFPDGTRVLTPSCMAKLLDALEKLYSEMLQVPLLMTKPSAIRPLLDQVGVAPHQLLGKYTKPLKKRK